MRAAAALGTHGPAQRSLQGLRGDAGPKGPGGGYGGDEAWLGCTPRALEVVASPDSSIVRGWQMAAEGAQGEDRGAVPRRETDPGSWTVHPGCPASRDRLGPQLPGFCVCE